MPGPGSGGSDEVISVHFPWMDQAAEDVRICHNTLVQEQEALANFLNNGLVQDWQGKGGMSWSVAQQNWNASADEVYLILGDLYRALSAAHANYTSTERSLESFWAS